MAPIRVAVDSSLIDQALALSGEKTRSSTLLPTMVGFIALLILTTPALANPLQLVQAARQQTQHHVTYDGRYTRIAYPMGDVPADRGVCTDVIIRAHRKLGIDLQQRVHEDMRAHFGHYPKLWGLTRPDPNIDHRRVPNLQKYFERQGARLAAARASAIYQPGDLVTWMLPGNLPHIGIVSDRQAAGTGRPLVIHNIGAGPVEDDSLFDFPITGHYRFQVQ